MRQNGGFAGFAMTGTRHPDAIYVEKGGFSCLAIKGRWLLMTRTSNFYTIGITRDTTLRHYP
ncbi:hypothetical protein CFR74_14425 [Novacetimonas hansenii]|nr:hypothetical protein CFR74_14425 [Novacetimonas hansenii]